MISVSVSGVLEVGIVGSDVKGRMLLGVGYGAIEALVWNTLVEGWGGSGWVGVVAAGEARHFVWWEEVDGFGLRRSSWCL